MAVLIVINIFMVMGIISCLGRHPEFMIKALVVTSVLTLSGLSVYFFMIK